jgi:hypothetical protein
MGMLRILMVAAMMASASASLCAQEVEVPATIHVPTFLKVLTFDRQRSSAASGEVIIAIAYQSGNRASTRAKDDVLRQIDAVGTLEGAPLRSLLIDLDQDRLDDMLAKSRPRALYVTPMRGVDLESICAATRVARVTTMTGVPRYVALGLAVGVRLQGERPKLMLNLTAARLEGADFSSELLRLVEITP